MSAIFSALAGAERVFARHGPAAPEEPDKPDADCARAPGGATWCSIDVTFGYNPGQGDSQGHFALCQARPEDRVRRLDRRGQDDRHQPAQPVLRRGRAARSPSTASNITRLQARLPARATSPWCCRTPTCSPAPSWRTSATAGWTRPTRRSSQTAKTVSARRLHPRLSDGYNTMIEGDGANLSAGTAPAAQHRPRGAEQGPHPGARRGHQLRRHPHRAPDRAGHGSR